MNLSLPLYAKKLPELVFETMGRGENDKNISWRDIVISHYFETPIVLPKSKTSKETPDKKTNISRR